VCRLRRRAGRRSLRGAGRHRGRAARDATLSDPGRVRSGPAGSDLPIGLGGAAGVLAGSTDLGRWVVMPWVPLIRPSCSTVPWALLSSAWGAGERGQEEAHLLPNDPPRRPGGPDAGPLARNPALQAPGPRRPRGGRT